MNVDSPDYRHAERLPESPPTFSEQSRDSEVMNEHVRYHAECVLTEGECECYASSAEGLLHSMKSANPLKGAKGFTDIEQDDAEMIGELLKLKLDSGRAKEPADIVREVVSCIGTFANIYPDE